MSMSMWNCLRMPIEGIYSALRNHRSAASAMWRGPEFQILETLRPPLPTHTRGPGVVQQSRLSPSDTLSSGESLDE